MGYTLHVVPQIRWQFPARWLRVHEAASAGRLVCKINGPARAQPASSQFETAHLIEMPIVVSAGMGLVQSSSDYKVISHSKSHRSITNITDMAR